MKMLWPVIVTVSLCSAASLCHGSECNIEMDTIRLVGGLSDQGLVETCSVLDNQWKSVCDFLWNDVKAEIVCRELNLTYTSARASSGGGCSAFNTSTSDEGIAVQKCTGEERSITECQRSTVNGNCSAAGVICSSPCDPSSCSGSNSQCLPPTSTCSCPTPSNTNCTCNESVCSPACLNDGKCTAPGECQCSPGWTGHTCQQAVCNPPCLNGGNCTKPDIICQCPDTWQGDQCQQAICDPPCFNGGNCIEPDVCQCPDAWEGDYCQQNTASNILVPIFVVVIVAVVLVVAVVLAVAGTVLGVFSALWMRRKAVPIDACSTSARPSISANDAVACKENISYGVSAHIAAAEYEDIDL